MREDLTMLTGKKLAPEMKQQILKTFPSPLSGTERVLKEHMEMAEKLVDLGYIVGSGKRSELPEDLVGLGVWE